MGVHTYIKTEEEVSKFWNRSWGQRKKLRLQKDDVELRKSSCGPMYFTKLRSGNIAGQKGGLGCAGYGKNCLVHLLYSTVDFT
jgi:hypothetical protein